LKKGLQVYIDGRLHTRHWVDDKGANHSVVEVVAQEMIMLGGSAENIETDQPEEQTSEDEYPF